MIRVHFHLTRKLIVVSERTPKGWRVAGYTEHPVSLTNVRFICSPKGRDYCRTFRNPNGSVGARFVHAWAEGDVAADAVTEGTAVSYNPFRDDGFTDGTRVVTRADAATFSLTGEGRARRILTSARGAA